MHPKPGCLALFLFAFLLCPSPGRAQTPENPSPESQQLYASALNLMSQGDMEGSLKKIDALLAKEPNNVPALNLRGAVLVRNKNFDEAEKAFSRILEKDPKNTIAMFNLAEVSFLRKDYAKARGNFVRFTEQPGNEQNPLSRYKVFLCDLLEVDPPAAVKTMESLEPTISNPFYYFARAAVEFKQHHNDKGREYVKSAFEIYPVSTNAAFADSLVALGWLKQEEVATVGAIDAASLNSLSKEFHPEKPATSAPSIGFENILPDFATGGGKKKDTPGPGKP